MSGAWQKYWFSRPANLSAAVVRMSLAASLLLNSNATGLAPIFTIDWKAFLESQSPELYCPFGPLWFFGPKVPSIAFCTFFAKGALVSTIFLLVGLFSRTSLLVSLVCNLIAWRVLNGFEPMWSHGENV